MPREDEEEKLRAVGLRIRALRREQGLKLNQIALLSGISAPALSLIETGKRNPRLTTLVRIAATYRVSLADLLDDKPRDTPREGRPGGRATTKGYDLSDYL